MKHAAVPNRFYRFTTSNDKPDLEACRSSLSPFGNEDPAGILARGARETLDEKFKPSWPAGGGIEGEAGFRGTFDGRSATFPYSRLCRAIFNELGELSTYYYYSSTLESKRVGDKAIDYKRKRAAGEQSTLPPLLGSGNRITFLEKRLETHSRGRNLNSEHRPRNKFTKARPIRTGNGNRESETNGR